tara:strand:- start:123 stop:320 length:198 start_codon:yes stop_codon:yes gene_type:complete
MGLLDKLQKGVSSLGFSGLTPEERAGANIKSQLHAQGETPAQLKGEHSVFDLDGVTPEKYQNPEK